MDREEDFFGRATQRINLWMTILAAAGAASAFVWRGWEWAAGFALGAAASWLNFCWIRKLVEALGGAAGGRPRKRLAIVLGLRYLLLAGAAYAILNYSSLSLTAALVGVFVSVAAVIVEILFELIYART